MAGHQPNYLPWLGFFDKLSHCDVFLVEDNVQFEPQGFQNRTRIKTFEGVKWLTVPVKHQTKFSPINEVIIANSSSQDWARRHWQTLKGNYSRAPYWGRFEGFFEQAFCQDWTKLIDLNMYFIRGLMGFFHIKKPLIFASSLHVSGKKNELVLEQCKTLNATTLLSGIGARSYLNVERFQKEGISIAFQNFCHPKYSQLGNDFVPGLSAVDYLFWTGGKEKIFESCRSEEYGQQFSP